MNIEELELVQQNISVNAKHVFTPEELAEEAQLLAQVVTDKSSKENEKKVSMSNFNNAIKVMDAELKVHSDNVYNGFIFKDVPCDLYRDYSRKKRVYIKRGTDIILKEEDFRESDIQKEIDFSEDTELTEIDRARQQQIEENNQVGGFAEGDQLDNVINDKKFGKGKKGEKPTPKDNLGEHYGKSHEQADDDDVLPNKDDLFKPTE